MGKFRGFLVLIFLVAAFGAKAQEDTTGGQSWMSLPVVTDTPKTDTQVVVPPIDDSAKKAAAAVDSQKVEDEKEFIKQTIKALCTKGMAGRGYVKNGSDSAAKYILKKFKQFKLQPVVEKGPYAQGFAFHVNTFPGRMDLFVNGDSMIPATSFMIDPASSSYSTDSEQTLSVKKINFHKVRDTAALERKLAEIDSAHAYYLKNLDDVSDKLNIRKDKLLAMLPPGRVYLVPEENKLTWNTRREPIASTVFYVREDSMPKRIKNIAVHVDAVFNPHQRSENIIACVPGTVKDTYVVFTAHYDHLGMMGSKTVFQGANDNASGVAMMLYLASYISKHPQHYSVLFIAFGAEEASLMGSEFYVWHPFVPLKNIKFLVNIEMMGDATNGITVVNATNNIPQYTLLQKINDKEKYLRTVYPRENAANSDHYHFSKMHVPCFFIYSNGGHGYYHEPGDVKTVLSLNHVDKVVQLLLDFTDGLKDVPNADMTQEKAEAQGITQPSVEDEPEKKDEPSSKPDETDTKPDEQSPTPEEK